MKTCSKSDCQQINPQSLSRFYKDKAFKDGLRKICKTCDDLRTKRNYIKNDKYRNVELKKKYGIDTAQYNQLLIKQQDKCAICQKHKSEFTYSLCVDHSHKTSQVRGLLCKPCNLIVGNAMDDTQILHNTIKYLEPYES